jgi:hypothetical protein
VLLHFFQDAYHLKDWLANDPASGVTDKVAENFVKGLDSKGPLAICGDLCNGSKHMVLDRRTRTGDKSTGVATQDASVDVGAGVAYSWSVESNGVRYDAHRLSIDILEAWDAWIAGHVSG